MYYKIENKECEVYKKLHEMRTNELRMQEENSQAIKDKSGLDFETFLGNLGQQNFGRVTQYNGFQFTEPEKVDLKIWKRHKEYNEVFIPNRKTKLGREMLEFINNGLQKSYFEEPLRILNLELPSKFSFPFVVIEGELILLYLNDKLEPKDENIIEITKHEFDSLRK